MCDQATARMVPTIAPPEMGPGAAVPRARTGWGPAALVPTQEGSPPHPLPGRAFPRLDDMVASAPATPRPGAPPPQGRPVATPNTLHAALAPVSAPIGAPKAASLPVVKLEGAQRLGNTGAGGMLIAAAMDTAAYMPRGLRLDASPPAGGQQLHNLRLSSARRRTRRYLEGEPGADSEVRRSSKRARSAPRLKHLPDGDDGATQHQILPVSPALMLASPAASKPRRRKAGAAARRRERRPSLRERSKQATEPIAVVLTTNPDFACSELPEHWRINKALPSLFQLVSLRSIEDGVTASVSAKVLVDPDEPGLGYKESPIKNNMSYFEDCVASFPDLRFMGKSGRGRKFNLELRIATRPEPVVITLPQIVKVTVDGPRTPRNRGLAAAAAAAAATAAAPPSKAGRRRSRSTPGAPPSRRASSKPKRQVVVKPARSTTTTVQTGTAAEVVRASAKRPATSKGKQRRRGPSLGSAPQVALASPSPHRPGQTSRIQGIAAAPGGAALGVPGVELAGRAMLPTLASPRRRHSFAAFPSAHRDSLLQDPLLLGEDNLSGFGPDWMGAVDHPWEGDFDGDLLGLSPTRAGAPPPPPPAALTIMGGGPDDSSPFQGHPGLQLSDDDNASEELTGPMVCWPVYPGLRLSSLFPRRGLAGDTCIVELIVPDEMEATSVGFGILMGSAVPPFDDVRLKPGVGVELTFRVPAQVGTEPEAEVVALYMRDDTTFQAANRLSFTYL